MGQLFPKMVHGWVESGVIRPQDEGLCLYGLEQGAWTLFNLATAFGVGFLFGRVWQTLGFLAFYIPLRSCAGGYHAKTPFRCYLLSAALVAAALLVMGYAVRCVPICCIMAMGGGLVIARFAPMEDSNKPLDSTERRVYGRRARVILCLLLGLFLLGLAVGWKEVPACIATAIALLGGMVGLGKMKNHMEEIVC